MKLDIISNEKIMINRDNPNILSNGIGHLKDLTASYVQFYCLLLKDIFAVNKSKCDMIMHSGNLADALAIQLFGK